MDDKEETLNHSGAKAFGASNKEVVVPSKLVSELYDFVKK